jgi:hypothetical protein
MIEVAVVQFHAGCVIGPDSLMSAGYGVTICLRCLRLTEAPVLSVL